MFSTRFDEQKSDETLKEMIDKRIKLKQKELETKSYKIESRIESKSTFCYQGQGGLNEVEFQVLKNKLPRQKILRRNILLRLDANFSFNRVKLAQYLADLGLNGYSRQHIYKILGKPAINSKEYEIMNKAFGRIGNPELLPLIAQRNVYKIITNSLLGCSKNGQAEK